MSKPRPASPATPLRTRLLVGVVAAAAAWTLAAHWPAALPASFWFWLLACVAGELMWVPLPFGRGSTVSMASCFNFAAVLVLAPGEALLATLLATALGERLGLRKPLLRVLYNTSHTVLAVAAAGAVFESLARTRDLVALLSRLELGPVLLAALTYYAINRAAVTLAIASCERVNAAGAWRRNFGNAYEALSSGAVFSLGALFATHFQGIGIAGTMLVALPLVLACDGLRRFHGGAKREGSADDENQRRAA